MFERFTDRARRTVVLAQEEARHLNHNYIGTEHLLLGLLAEPDSVAAKALTALGITHGEVRDEVREIIGDGASAPSGHIPFTPRSKKVLELALREALALGHNYIGTEHILLGLVREGEGVAAQVLVKRGADLDKVRTRVIDMLSGPGARIAPKSRRARTPAAGEVLAAAEELAGGGPVGTHHLLEAIVQAEGSMAAAVLAGLGVEADAVVARLDAAAIDDTTDATPELVGARRMELRIEGDEVHLVLQDPETLERAREVLELNGGVVEGSSPVASGFVAGWHDVHVLLADLLAQLRPAPTEPDLPGWSLLGRRIMQSRLRRRRR